MSVVSVTKNRAESRGRIARAWAATAPAGWVVVNGDKTEGIDALIKDIKAQSTVAGRVAKSHGKVAWLERTEDTPPGFADWIDAAAPSKNTAGFWTQPGIFSPDKPDQGSQRLAEHFGAKIKGRVADFGAGWGWLSAQLLEKAADVAVVDLYEAQKPALDMARRNVTDPRATFHWADIPQTPCTDPYDMIIMNPPFHEGRKAEPALGASFIAAAKRFLKPNGQLLMVANRHLPYEAALNEAFRRVEKRAEDPQFKVYLAAKPRR